jgi:hypothetical protein
MLVCGTTAARPDIGQFEDAALPFPRFTDHPDPTREFHALCVKFSRIPDKKKNATLNSLAYLQIVFWHEQCVNGKCPHDVLNKLLKKYPF